MQRGLEKLAIQDHAYNPDFLDVWTLISFRACPEDCRPEASVIPGERSEPKHRSMPLTASRRWSRWSCSGLSLIARTTAPISSRRPADVGVRTAELSRQRR